MRQPRQALVRSRSRTTLANLPAVTARRPRATAIRQVQRRRRSPCWRILPPRRSRGWPMPPHRWMGGTVALSRRSKSRT
eukprot:5658329-Lingulodinium_polyedra.AAC.1